MDDIQREKRHFMPQPWRLSLVVSHAKTPILNCFHHLFWFHVLTVSEFSCLTKS